jgi:hypothetical protein
MLIRLIHLSKAVEAPTSTLGDAILRKARASRQTACALAPLPTRVTRARR